MATLALRPNAEDKSSDRHVMVVCTGESCRYAGAGQVLKELKHHCKHTKVEVRVGTSKCMGRCGLAPAMMEDGHMVGFVSNRRVRAELMRIGAI